MSETESKLKEENELIKKLFNFIGGEVQLKYLKDVFASFIKNSKNGLNYFIDLLDYYSRCRPHQHNVSKELIECVYSSFPEQINEIQQIIRKTVYFQKNFQ